MRPRPLQLFRPGLLALKAYWKPILIIEAIAGAIVATYFLSPAFAGFCTQLASLSKRAGLPGSAVVSAIAGGILPEIAKLAAPQIKNPPLKRWLQDVAFNILFFGFSGMVVALFYAAQSRIFGDDTHPLTLAKKVAFDQFVFTVLWATPLGLIAFSLRDHRFKLTRAWPDIIPARLAVRAPGLLLTNWAFWIPMCILIYALPDALQFPLFTCALAAWSLLLVFIATEPRVEAAAIAAPPT